ncbi:MAG: TRAFs-binding domain-containing protein [Gammaproteobacteria bacterium]
MTTEASGFKRRVFVVMPFGTKEVPKKPCVDAPPAPETSAEALKVDFDSVYQRLFKPALEAAGLQPFRADDEEAAGDILKDMFAELVTADFVLADISILNANVFYELGIRHTVGPRGVICLHAGWADRPFDITPQRTFKYNGQLFRAGLEQDAAWEGRLAAEVLRLGITLRKAVAVDRTTEGSPIYSNLPNLVPPDASGIGTARFKHYQAQSSEWNQRVKIAGKEGRAEDILTIAGDVPSPYYRRKLLRQCGETLLALGRFCPAEQVFQELTEEFEGSGSADEVRVKSQLALIANRLHRRHEAEEKLAQLAESSPDHPDVPGFLGRVYKDMWRTTFAKAEKVEDRLRAAMKNATVARRSLETYQAAVRRDINRFYHGVNVVTLAVLLEHVARANQRAPKCDVPDLEELKVVVRLAAKGALERPEEEIWARATLGELALVAGQMGEALEEYEQAIADPDLTWFSVRSMHDQVQLFQQLGYQPEAVAPVAGLLQARCDELGRPGQRYGKVVIGSGHMIDAPEREKPRFPTTKAKAVCAQIACRLDQWDIGPGDLAVCGGASGADILFAEECLRRGAHTRLLLAQEVDDFVRASVRCAGHDWVQRFHALLEKAEVATQPERLGKEPNGVSIYARNNRWIVNTGRAEADSTKRIYAIVVWNQRESEGQGGAEDLAHLVGAHAGIVEVINPELVEEPPVVAK